MRNFKIFFNLWLPVIFWCGLLFYLSSVPNLKVVENSFWDEILRSGAHFGFYVGGYFLFFRAVNFQKEKKSFLLPLILVGLYGLFDEVHQTFVPSRTFQIQDLMIDFAGAFLGMTSLAFSK